MGFIHLAGANLLLTTFASVLCVCFAPTAAGPGIPEIKAYLNGVDTPNMFGATTMIVKVGWLFQIECLKIISVSDCSVKLIYNTREILLNFFCL